MQWAVRPLIEGPRQGVNAFSSAVAFAWVGLGGSLSPERPGPVTAPQWDQGLRGTAEEVAIHSDSQSQQNNQTQSQSALK